MAPSAATILGMLPIAVFGTGVLVTPPAPAPIAPVAVQVEGFTARRMDADTFRRRWPSDLPPPAVIREVRVPAVAETTTHVIPSPRPARIVKSAALRRDICTRHGLRKIEVVRGKWKGWRCKR